MEQPIFVSPGVYRGARPSSDSDFILLKQLDIRTILNLESGFYERLFSHRNHEFLASVKNRMISLHLNMSNFLPPTTNEIYSAIQVLTDPKFGKSYVHCLHGVDRTGVICAAYRCLVQNWELDKAYQEMVNYGFHRWFYFWWKPFMMKSIKSLKGIKYEQA